VGTTGQSPIRGAIACSPDFGQTRDQEGEKKKKKFQEKKGRRVGEKGRLGFRFGRSPVEDLVEEGSLSKKGEGGYPGKERGRLMLEGKNLRQFAVKWS